MPCEYQGTANFYGTYASARKGVYLKAFDRKSRRFLGECLLAEPDPKIEGKAAGEYSGDPRSIARFVSAMPLEEPSMKKLIVPAVCAGAGLLIWKTFFAPPSAYATYERFAEAMLRDRWEEARSLAAGPQAKTAVAAAEELPRRVGQERYRLSYGVVHGDASRKLESEDTSADGKRVTLRVIQEIRRGPATMARAGKPTVRQTHNVVLVETGGGWQVEEFKETSAPLGDR